MIAGRDARRRVRIQRIVIVGCEGREGDGEVVSARRPCGGGAGPLSPRRVTDVDAGVKVSIFAGLGVSLGNRRMPIADLRMSKVRTVLPALSFDILRFGVLRFCGSVSGRRRRRPFSNRRKKNTFIAALTVRSGT
jgi:hypothetical protein